MIGNIVLSRAVFALNSRIRHTHRSAQELLFKRDQYSGSSIEVDDSKISEDQNEKRKKDNVSKVIELNNKLRTKITDREYKTGDLISDKNKHGKRDVYIIVEVEEDKVSDVKFKHGKNYTVKEKISLKLNLQKEKRMKLRKTPISLPRQQSTASTVTEVDM